MLSKEVSNSIFESLVWLDLGLNPGLPDYWWTHCSLDQCHGYFLEFFLSKPRERRLKSQFSFSKTGLKEPSLLYYFIYSWRENSWIHAFSKDISTMWNASSLVQDLNSCRCIHFQWRNSWHHGHLRLCKCIY